MTVREYKGINDLPGLKKLWIDVFEDPEKFVDDFFEALPDIGSCVLGEEDGKIIAMASVIAGQELQFAGSVKATECGYIYAVAVDENHRGKGYGKKITKAAYELALKREAGIVCTLPASSSLYSFYADALGFETALYREKHEVPSNDLEMTMKLSSTEYNMMREGLLNGKTFLRLSPYAMRFLMHLCEDFEGGLYASMSGICTAIKKEDTCIICEIISRNPDVSAASVAYTLGCKKAVYYLPSTKGEPFIAADPGKIPKESVWNIAYE